jgi:hypothetical protein
MKNSSKNAPGNRGMCLVSRMVFDETYPVGFMYREVPEEQEDSGWRFLSGHENEAYLDDDNNSLIVAIELIMVLDKAIVPHLLLPYGSELERQNDEFVPYVSES